MKGHQQKPLDLSAWLVNHTGERPTVATVCPSPSTLVTGVESGALQHTGVSSIHVRISMSRADHFWPTADQL